MARRSAAVLLDARVGAAVLLDAPVGAAVLLARVGEVVLPGAGVAAAVLLARVAVLLDAGVGAEVLLARVVVLLDAGVGAAVLLARVAVLLDAGVGAAVLLHAVVGAVVHLEGDAAQVDVALQAGAAAQFGTDQTRRNAGVADEVQKPQIAAAQADAGAAVEQEAPHIQDGQRAQDTHDAGSAAPAVAGRVLHRSLLLVEGVAQAAKAAQPGRPPEEWAGTMPEALPSRA